MSNRRHPLDDALSAILPRGSLFAVGGRVRDELRAAADGIPRTLKDLDYVVVGVGLDALIERLRSVGRVDVVGASFAVIKLQAPAGSADIALPRRERSTGAGHRDFAVESGPAVPLEDDLARRDFRMNMIARSIDTGDLIDPFRGAADIRARRIDILTPLTFEEDPLRMLRAAQFAARFDYAPAPRVIDAMSASAARIQTVSAERIGDELGKLFALSAVPSRGIELLRATGLLAYVWPELLEGVAVEQNEWHAFDVYRHNLETLDAAPLGDLTLRLASLLHDVGKGRTKDGPHFYRHEQVGAELAPPMLERLRLPAAVIESVTHLVRHHMFSADPELEPKAVRRFVRRIGVEHLDRLFALRMADVAGSGLPKRDGSNEAFAERVREILAEQPPFSIRDLAIDGRTVIDLFERAGEAISARGDRRVGEVLRYLFEKVTDDPRINDPAILRGLALQWIGENAAQRIE